MAARLSWRRRLIAGALLLVAAGVAVAVLSTSRSAGRRPAGTGIPPGETTATVTRRTLSESATVDGTLTYSGEQSIYNRLAGTYTWLPASGAHIGRDGTLYRLDNLPVLLMYGAVPAYRTLALGVSEGPDVSELNENLIALGFDPYRAISDVDRFSEATAAAVRRWQSAHSLPQTGRVQLGRVVFASSALRVTSVHVVLGQDPAPSATTPASEGEPSGSSKPSGSHKPSGSSKHPSKPSGSRKPSGSSKHPSKPSGSHKPSGSSKHPSKPSGSHKPSGSSKPSGASKPTSGSSEPSKKPSSGESSHPSSSEKGAGGGGEQVLSATSTRQIVQLNVKAEQQELAHLGERVAVTLPGGSVTHGRVSSVGTVASEPKSNGEKGGSNEAESPTISVTITLARPVAHLDHAPVSAELVKSVSRDVLTVPATALIATAGGGYAVEALEGVRHRTVSVTPGMFANGYVEVEGAGIREGLTVLESQ